MAAQVIPIDRRRYPRHGLLGVLEQITYATLRQHGAIGNVTPPKDELVERSRVAQESRVLAARLRIVVSNLEPKREQSFPQTWLLHTHEEKPVKVHVAHDHAGKPHVVGKGSASDHSLIRAQSDR